MIIITNGTPLELPEGATMGDAARRLSLDPRALIAELNEEALTRDEWPHKVLRENDRVEFLRIAAGG